MNDNMKDLENTNLTDEQTTEVAGGFPVVSRPFPRNAKLEDKQAEQVSGGSASIHIKRENASDHEQNNRNPNEVKYKPEPWYH